MKELYERITYSHEAEFEYNGITYVLQPEVDNDKAYLVIWDLTPDNAKCIAKREIPMKGNTPNNIIDEVLSEKCFNGKSFLEIEKDVTVTVIF